MLTCARNFSKRRLFFYLPKLISFSSFFSLPDFISDSGGDTLCSRIDKLPQKCRQNSYKSTCRGGRKETQKFFYITPTHFKFNPFRFRSRSFRWAGRKKKNILHICRFLIGRQNRNDVYIKSICLFRIISLIPFVRLLHVIRLGFSFSLFSPETDFRCETNSSPNSNPSWSTWKWTVTEGKKKDSPRSIKGDFLFPDEEINWCSMSTNWVYRRIFRGKKEERRKKTFMHKFQGFTAYPTFDVSDSIDIFLRGNFSSVSALRRRKKLGFADKWKISYQREKLFFPFCESI